MHYHIAYKSRVREFLDKLQRALVSAQSYVWAVSSGIDGTSLSHYIRVAKDLGYRTEIRNTKDLKGLEIHFLPILPDTPYLG